MRAELLALKKWSDEGKRYACACVLKTWGSSPRPVGSLLGVAEDGSTVGSVSGGCVEAAVIERANEVLMGGGTSTMRFAKIGADEVWEVGLSCGGEIEVLVWEPVGEPWSNFLAQAHGVAGCAVYIDLEAGVVSDVAQENSFHLKLTPQPVALIVGWSHIGEYLAPILRSLEFFVRVIDPRVQLIASLEGRLADEVQASWPQDVLVEADLTRDTFAIMLSHDNRIDLPTLRMLLSSDVPYIGVLGSRTTHAQRLEGLCNEGFSTQQLSRIHGPIGLAIAARTPPEIAISIAAQIVQVLRA